MNENQTISIIIAIYQASETLKRCIESIRRQTDSDWEAILIDDGSDDGSGALCDLLAEQDHRIRVIHTENRGVSAARNLGLNEARGGYIAFADADDWMDPQMLESLRLLLTQSGADCAACGYYLDFGNGRTLCPAKALTEDVIDGEAALVALLQRNYYRGFLWNKLFRIELFYREDAPLRLDESLSFCEDLHLNFRCLLRGANLRYDPRPLYHYCIHPKSLTEGFGDHRFTELEAYRHMAAEPELSQRIRDFLQCRYAEAAVNLLYEAIRTKNRVMSKWLKRESAALLIPFLRNTDLSVYEKLRMTSKLYFPMLTMKALRFLRGKR